MGLGVKPTLIKLKKKTKHDVDATANEKIDIPCIRLPFHHMLQPNFREFVDSEIRLPNEAISYQMDSITS